MSTTYAALALDTALFLLFASIVIIIPAALATIIGFYLAPAAGAFIFHPLMAAMYLGYRWATD